MSEWQCCFCCVSCPGQPTVSAGEQRNEGTITGRGSRVGLDAQAIKSVPTKKYAKKKYAFNEHFEYHSLQLRFTSWIPRNLQTRQKYLMYPEYSALAEFQLLGVDQADSYSSP